MVIGGAFWSHGYNDGGEVMEKESLSVKVGLVRPLWWVIHCVGIALVYAIGHLLWR